MCSWIHSISPISVLSSYIVRSEHIILGANITLMTSYLEGRFSKIGVHILAQVHFHCKRVLSHQTAEVSIKLKAHKRHRFTTFAHCSLPLPVLSWRRGLHNVSHDVLLFYVVSNETSSFFLDVVVVFYFSVVCRRVVPCCRS